ncbi:hypothetical protein I3760_03G000100 [Carya illinoinensis]|nr:hypothetical protein I3760_03G000100 [Carya illinoinensis]
MKAILLIICLLLASSVLFVPSSVLARELKVEQADASYPPKRRGVPCGRGEYQRNCTRLIPPPPPPTPSPPPPPIPCGRAYKRKCPPPP